MCRYNNWMLFVFFKNDEQSISQLTQYVFIVSSFLLSFLSLFGVSVLHGTPIHSVHCAVSIWYTIYSGYKRMASDRDRATCGVPLYYGCVWCVCARNRVCCRLCGHGWCSSIMSDLDFGSQRGWVGCMSVIVGECRAQLIQISKDTVFV